MNAVIKKRHLLVKMCITGLLVLFLISAIFISCRDVTSSPSSRSGFHTVRLKDNAIQVFQNAEPEEKDYIVLSGYIKTLTGECISISDDLKGLQLQSCSLNTTKESLFHWTYQGNLKVQNKCLTRMDTEVVLEKCYQDVNVQVWSEPTEEQFILAREIGTCLRQGSKKKVEADNCFKDCEKHGFQFATWFLVRSPEAALNPHILEKLKQLETKPGQIRYCLKQSN